MSRSGRSWRSLSPPAAEGCLDPGETGGAESQALADRLTTRTEATLLRYQEDSDAEVRRAAALALGMRDAKGTVAEIARLLLDAEPAVVRAAHASLVSLTGEDYGPAVGATEEQRAEACKRYRAWKPR